MKVISDIICKILPFCSNKKGDGKDYLAAIQSSTSAIKESTKAIEETTVFFQDTLKELKK